MSGAATKLPRSIEEVQNLLKQHRYIADRNIAVALYLSLSLGKPLLIEGPAGVGKTEIARVLSKALATRLIRLQCYEGLDAHTALYEWNFPKQMLRLRMEEGSDRPIEERERSIFGPEFLLERPLLAALRQPDQAPVLLIDELDRADTEFDAFLLEVLEDFQITIPELGTIQARHRPYVIITSNRTRELSDALRRRCLYLWIDYPSKDKELAIIEARLPGIDAGLAAQVAEFVDRVRRLDLEKPPGTAETLDWARALLALERTRIDAQAVVDAMTTIVKTRDDQQVLRRALASGQLEVEGVEELAPDTGSP